MQYKVIKGITGSAVFLDTGERFYKRQMYPLDHVFECKYLIHASDDVPYKHKYMRVLCTTANEWISTLSNSNKNHLFTTLVRMNRAIRYGTVDLVDTPREIMHWTADEDGETLASVQISDLLLDLSETFGEPNGLLLSMEQYVTNAILAERLSPKLIDIPDNDKSIRFQERHMVELLTLVVFFRVMCPVTWFYLVQLVHPGAGQNYRPFIDLYAPYAELIDSYCSETIDILHHVIRQHTAVTCYSKYHDSEAHMRRNEYLIAVLPCIDVFNLNIGLVDILYSVFRGNR